MIPSTRNVSSPMQKRKTNAQFQSTRAEPNTTAATQGSLRWRSNVQSTPSALTERVRTQERAQSERASNSRNSETATGSAARPIRRERVYSSQSPAHRYVIDAQRWLTKQRRMANRATHTRGDKRGQNDKSTPINRKTAVALPNNSAARTARTPYEERLAISIQPADHALQSEPTRQEREQQWRKCGPTPPLRPQHAPQRTRRTIG